MKQTLALCLILVSLTVIHAFEKPNIHTSVMLDALHYDGDNANQGAYDTANRVQIRKAELGLEGALAEYMNYEIAFGVSTCQGGGIDFKLMEAVLEYELPYNIIVAIQQGHVLRGIAGSTECSDRMTLEKPIFHTSLFNCHPTGIVVRTVQELGMESEVEFEAAFMNGGNQTMSDEWDFNYGLIYRTPLQGLSVALDYNHVGRIYYDNLGQIYTRAGSRMIGGLSYEDYNITVAGEYFAVKGYTTEEDEMSAYYAMLGYSFPVDSDRIKAIQPYAMYEYWDKDSANDTESEYTYLNAGFNLTLNKYTKLRFGYQTELDKPDGAEEKPDSATLRLQIVY